MRFTKKPAKHLRDPRRTQTARMLQSTRLLTATLANMLRPEGTSFVQSMNAVLAKDKPQESVGTDREAAGKACYGTLLGFPSLVLVFLMERFGKSATVKKRFVKALERSIRDHPGPDVALKIVKLKHQGPEGFHIDQPRNETREEAILRHLRNVFAHGSWQLDEGQLPDRFVVRVVDYRPEPRYGTVPDDLRTFEADVDLRFLLDLTERMLLAAFKHLSP